MFGDQVYSGATLATVPQLNLFEGPVVQSGVERSMFIEYRPTSQISSQDAPVQFSLGGDSAHYLDLKRTRLYMKLKIVNEDGTALAEGDMPSPTNFILHSLWSQIELRVSGKVVSLSNNCYPYKAYLQALLKSSDSAKMSHMAGQMFRQDDGDVDKVTANSGAAWRAKRFAKSNVVTLEGELYEDVMQTNRYILNNTPVDIKLFRARQPFTILTESDKKYKIEIVDVSLKACYVDVHPGIISGHSAALSKGNALYPYTRVEMLTFNLSAGSRQFNLDNLFSSQCPTTVIVAFVESDSFSGHYQKNPFNFKPFGLTEIGLSADGQHVPGRSLVVPEFDNNGSQVVAPYMRLYDCLGVANKGSFGNGLDPEDFARGFAIYCFPVYGGGTDTHYMQMKRSAHVRIEGSFSKPLDAAVTVLVYAESPGLLEIEGSRNVIVN